MLRAAPLASETGLIFLFGLPVASHLWLTKDCLRFEKGQVQVGSRLSEAEKEQVAASWRRTRALPGGRIAAAVSLSCHLAQTFASSRRVSGAEFRRPAKTRPAGTRVTANL